MTMTKAQARKILDRDHDLMETEILRVGDIVVEYRGEIDRNSNEEIPGRFARFVSVDRARDFSDYQRSRGLRVKAWKLDGDDQSHVCDL